MFQLSFTHFFGGGVTVFSYTLPRQMGEMIQFDLRIFLKRVVQAAPSHRLFGWGFRKTSTAPFTWKPQNLHPKMRKK